MAEGPQPVDFDDDDYDEAFLEASSDAYPEDDDGEASEEDAEEEEGEDSAAATATDRLAHVLFGWHRRRPNLEAFSGLRRLPVVLPPVGGELAAHLHRATGASNPRNPLPQGMLSAGHDPLASAAAAVGAPAGVAAPPRAPPRGRSAAQPLLSQQQGSSGGGGGGGPTTRSRASAAAAAGAPPTPQTQQPAERGRRRQAVEQQAAPSTSQAPPSQAGGFHAVNTASLLLAREADAGCCSGFSRAQRRHLCCFRSMPCHALQVMDEMDSRAYIGQYSADGQFFVAAFQDRRVRLYDTTRDWRLRKDITTRMIRWTITDTTLSPDQRFLVYSSITPIAYLVHVASSMDVVESMANITELHDALAFDGRRSDGGEDDEAALARSRGFGIWSIAWSPAGGEIIAGTNDHSVYVYDLESKRAHIRLLGHADDVNAVAFLDPASPNMIASGSDDTLIKIWDRRLAGGICRKPVGVFVGHTEGLTHLCARGDGRHLLSNAKDQTAKLWDVRRMVGGEAHARAPRVRVPSWSWDYRWEPYPAAAYEVVHPQDGSLMTYRGHKVLQTLIRAYFSPEHSTGGRFVYGGSQDGRILVWDALTGKVVRSLSYHRALCRDVSWHPYEPELTTVSWDGRVVRWGEAPPPPRRAGGGGLPPPVLGQMDGY